MTGKRDRRGQVIGPWEVLEEAGHSRSGRKLLWRARHLTTGDERVFRTCELIRLDRRFGGTTPPPLAE